MGPTVQWSPAIRTLARSIFDSPFPICLWSGPRYALLYNDAYRRILAAKHPAALGQSGSAVWAEIWEQLQPQFDGVRAGGEPIHFEDAPFVMARLEGGGTETAWFNYSLSALRDENGSVVAILNITPETTEKVLAEQQLRDASTRREALLKLDDRLRDVASAANLSFAASELLGTALGVARVGYGAVDAKAGTNKVARTWSLPSFSDVAGDHDFNDYGSYVDDLRRGEAVANADVVIDPRTKANAAAFGAIGIRAHLDVPVFEHGEMVAIMFVHAAMPRIWTKDEIAFVRDFAERTHVAITRRQAEAALRASEEFNRRVLESSVDCIKVLDLDARLEFMSEGGMCVMEVDDFGAIEGACWPDLVGRRARQGDFRR